MFPHHLTPHERRIWRLCQRLHRLEIRYLLAQRYLYRRMITLLEAPAPRRS